MKKIEIVIAWLICLSMVSCASTKKPLGHISGYILIESDTSMQKVLVQYDTIQTKYAALLKINPEMIKTPRLYYFIEKWIDTPYKWGGMDHTGIDCSAFLQRLFAEVYTAQLPRTSVQQFFTDRIEAYASPKYLKEGDLVFFRTSNKALISHVGLYLHNKMFINSSSSKGVSIANLDDPYWKSRYVASGRVKWVEKRD